MNPQRDTEEIDPELAPGTLLLWRVSMMATVEVGAFSRSEAQYQAACAIEKGAHHLLRPYRLETLGILERPEPEEEDVTVGAETKMPQPISPVDAPLAGAARDAAELLHDHGGQSFQASTEIKEKWVAELVEKITGAVAERLGQIIKA